MKIFAFLFCFILSQELLAKNRKDETSQEEVWKAGIRFVPLIRNQKDNLLYSKSCIDKKCDAFVKTKNISWKDYNKELSNSGGKNPGAVLCKEVLKQNIIYLKDLRGNENTFCLFQDKSFISSSSLSYMASPHSKKGNK